MLLGRGKNQATFVICNTSGWKEEKKFTALSTVSLYLSKNPLFITFLQKLFTFLFGLCILHFCKLNKTEKGCKGQLGMLVL